MKNILTKISKSQFTLSVPETIEEFDQKHGRAGAVLDKGIQYDVAHTILGKIRSAMGVKLVKLGATRDTAGTDDKGEPIYKVIDIKWLDRAAAELNIDAAALSKMYQELADEIGYDVSGTRGGSREFNQVDLKDAKSLLEAIKLGKTTYARIKSNLETRNPGLEVEVDDNGEVTAEQLAAGLKVERARAEAERQASLSGLI